MRSLGKDENGLTQKQRLFCDEYLLTGNAHKSFLKYYNYKKDVLLNTVAQDINRSLKKPEVKAYLASKRSKSSIRNDIDRDYIIQKLIKIVEDNEGDVTSLHSLKLLGKQIDVFLDIPIPTPAIKLPKEISTKNNVEAVQEIVTLTKDGEISDDRANHWLDIIEKKSKIEERESINKEILERLDVVGSFMKDKLNEID